MNTIDSYTFSGKKALIRVDFNVPLNKEFQITDDTRIRAAIPTLMKILKGGGSAILMSHLGRPKTGPEEKYSLKHLAGKISELTGAKVLFASDCIGSEAVEMAKVLKPGEILLLENLRFYKEEEKGDVEFARKLSLLGQVYVNDAFGTAHRAHASTTIIAQFFPNDKLFGYVMAEEVGNLKKVLTNPARPFTAIIGGAKVSDKIMVIKRLLEKVDNLIIGGGMSYTFSKAAGAETGNSLVELDKLELAREIVAMAKEKGVKLFLPKDSVISDAFSNDGNRKVSQNHEIPVGWMGLDIGQEACDEFSEVIKGSKTILWNGPMGVFEMSHFENGTKTIALSTADATASGTYSLVGGGDSVAALNKYGLASRVSYVSTGGGAMLEYLEGKVLPGVAALEN